MSAFLGVLGRVVQQVGQDLGHANRVGIDLDRPGRQRDREPMAVSIDDRAAGLHGVGDDHGHIDHFLLEPDLAPGDPGDLQQIVHKLRQLLDLVVDHVASPAKGRVFRPALLHDLDGVADRGQGIAQLVAEHRQELVLAGVGLGQLAGVRAKLVLQPLSFREVEAEGHDR